MIFKKWERRSHRSSTCAVLLRTRREAHASSSTHGGEALRLIVASLHFLETMQADEQKQPDGYCLTAILKDQASGTTAVLNGVATDGIVVSSSSSSSPFSFSVDNFTGEKHVVHLSLLFHVLTFLLYRFQEPFASTVTAGSLFTSTSVTVRCNPKTR